MDGDKEGDYVVKLMGMPFSASCEDVAFFLAGLDIKGGRKSGIHFTKDESGRASGECYVEMTCQEDANAALRKDHEYMGERWVSVARSTHQDMEDDMNKEGAFKEKLDAKGEYVVKIRGLPWSCTVEDIESFFQGCQLKVDKDTSIHILRNGEGRLTGQAFVEFADADSVQTAIGRNREHMGKRYLEVNRSDMNDMSKFTERSNSVSKMREPVVLCRGLPFSATEEDVCSFFSGLEIVDMQLVYDKDGVRPMGKCFVQFANVKDSEEAMTKFGEKMGARYVEIFQSNRKYWYSQEGGGDDARHTPPPPMRSRSARPSPYSKPPGPRDMGHGPAAHRGSRVKHMAHGISRSYGHGGPQSGGYDGTDGFPVQEYGPGAGAGSRAGGLSKNLKHIVVVKGVSMEVSLGDVIKFFTDATPPKNVEMKLGEAVVEFNSHADAMRAMLKDKTNLGGVKVILELQSKPADYVGYDSYHSAGPPATADPYSDPYSASYNDPYQSATSYQGSTYTGGNYRW